MQIAEAILIAIAVNITGPDSGFAGDPVATWSYADAEKHVAISVDVNGRCAVAGRLNQTGQSSRLECGYWLVGSRLHLRFKHPTLRERPVIVLEHHRELDQLILPGDAPITFIRQSMEHRNE
jgi:hypothetical protein